MNYARISIRSWALPALATLGLAVLSSLPVQAAEPDPDILGKWRITKVLDSSEISALDDNEAARLVGTTLVIDRDKVSLAGETCVDPEFELHYEDTVRYLREEAHAASGRLGLPSVVTVVDLACTEALLKGHGRIVLYWKGFFFDAIKQQPGEATRQQAKR
jgi:hypothetical protein